MGKSLTDRDAFDALAAPTCINLTGIASPDLIGVITEEEFIEFPPEAVNEEILEGLLFLGMSAGCKVTDEDGKESRRTQILNGLCTECDGIREEMPVVEDAGKARAGKEYVIGRFGIRAAILERAGALQKAIVIGRLSLEWQDILPDGVDLLVFREETVAADIDMATVMVHGAGKATDKSFLLDEYWMDVGGFEQFVSGGKPRRACADDDGSLQEDPSLIHLGII